MKCLGFELRVKDVGESDKGYVADKGFDGWSIG